ncbi:urokinase plasminogen activator surface receptor-like isoform X1 [Ambystoma mexicanum]|uniref:urokinase plasminogen activator surface receptor-like isoform X1 n=1 Tax=Ambystoma mexicanum TaxID=8296 RepID=UPI0037E913B0
MKALLLAVLLSILHVAVQDLPHNTIITKGCSPRDNNVCNQTTSTVKSHTSSTKSTRCCDGNLCNRALFSAQDVDLPGELDCLACNGSPSLCAGSNLPHLRCSAGESRCVEMSIAGSLNGDGKMKWMMKGCAKSGSCGSLAAFSSGASSISYYANAKCCNGSECNSGTFTEIVPEDANGLECYSCSETGKGECSPKNTMPMKCLGSMTQCADIRGKTSGKVLRSGCATEAFCQGHYPDFRMAAKNHTSCCSGSLCNHKRDAGIKVTE